MGRCLLEFLYRMWMSIYRRDKYSGGYLRYTERRDNDATRLSNGVGEVYRGNQMNCGFCNCRMVEGGKEPSGVWDGFNYKKTCWGCGVGYTFNKLTDYAHVGSPWKPIPEGCLLVIELEHCTEEIK